MTNQYSVWRKHLVGLFFLFFSLSNFGSFLSSFLLRTLLVINICFPFLGSVQPWNFSSRLLLLGKKARLKDNSTYLHGIRSWNFYEPHYRFIPECFWFIKNSLSLTLWFFFILEFNYKKRLKRIQIFKRSKLFQEIEFCKGQQKLLETRI